MNGIPISLKFKRTTSDPIDGYSIVDDLAALEAIPAVVRYIGMEVFVTSQKKKYRLTEGLTNDDWDDKIVYVIGVTYTELTALISADGLIQGQKYLITDYKTKHLIDGHNDIHEGNLEPIIVEAVSSNKLHAIAKSSIYKNDYIFYNVNDNLCEDDLTPRTGHIYRRIDNACMFDIPFDFRNVKFRRYAVAQTEWDDSKSYSAGDIVQIADEGVFISIIDNNTDNPIPFNTWAKIIDLTNTKYWGIAGGNINGVTFSEIDYIDVYLFNDISNANNSSGVHENGDIYIGFKNVKIIEPNDYEKIKMWNGSGDRYGNNVFHYDSTSESSQSYHGNITFINGITFDESYERIVNNTFGSCASVYITGSFWTNVIGGMFDVKLSDVHTVIESNYIGAISQYTCNTYINQGLAYNFIGNITNSINVFPMSCIIKIISDSSAIKPVCTISDMVMSFFKHNVLHSSISDVDNSAVILQSNTPCEIINSQAGGTCLRYINSSNIQVITTDTSA